MEEEVNYIRCYVGHVPNSVMCPLNWEYRCNVQVCESEMVKVLKETDLPEPWFGNKSKPTTAPKRTRVTPKAMPAHSALEAEAEGQGLNKGKGREKGKNKENVAKKGKLSVKIDRMGPTVVVAGRLKNPVADPHELRRKRVEDAYACGRVVKTIPLPEKRRSSTKIATTECSEQKSEDVMAQADKDMGADSPCAVEATAQSGGTSCRTVASTL